MLISDDKLNSWLAAHCKYLWLARLHLLIKKA